MIGRTVGKYRFVEKLGRGGMGTVYKAVDETLDREVAIKILNPDLTDASLMKRFRMEASTLARLNHPVIATIFELYRQDDDLLMVMEFVRGETLDQLAQRTGPLSPERAAYLVAAVLDAVGHAHAAGIVHRDLKPSNVMVTEAGTVKIMDFGIARVRGTEHMTTDGSMMGTPAYMSPEQVLSQEIDGRSDLYSIGVMFYRLLTGKLPFQADTAIGMVQKQVNEMPTPARLHRASLPAWTITILDRALAKSPADRYQTAEEFRSALLDATHSEVAEATRVLSSTELARASAMKALRPTPPQAETDPAAADPSGTGALPAVATGAVEVGPPPSTASLPSMPAIETVAPTEMPAEEPVAPKPDLAAAVGAAAVSAAAVKAASARPRKKNTLALAAVAATVTVALLVVGLAVRRRSAAANRTTDTSSQAAVSTTAPAASTALPSEPPPAPPSTEIPPAAEPAVPPAVAETPSPSVAATAPTTPTAPLPATPAASRAARTAGREGGTPTARADQSRPVTPEEPKATPPAPDSPPAPAIVPAEPKAILPTVTFAAKLLARDGDKMQERDAKVRLADQVTVIAGDQSVLSTVAYDTVLSVIYSKSKQPLWDAPGGAVPIERVQGGAFGFLKGGRHWVALRMKERFVVLRVEENQVPALLSALETRTGKTAVRLTEPAGSR